MLLTRPEGYEPADKIDRPRRVALRYAATAPFLALGFLYAAVYGNVRVGSQISDTILSISLILLTVGVIPMVMLGFLYLRAIAKRARSAANSPSTASSSASGTSIVAALRKRSPFTSTR